MQIARSTMILPQHFLEEIVARMPYSRSIFTFRCLSKGWLARLSPVESLEDDGGKQLANSFQKLQVLGRFNNWDPSFFLIFSTSDKNCCAYDCTSYTNRVVLPSLSFISKELCFERIMYSHGPLVLLPLRAPKTSKEMFEEQITGDTSVLYITNICTGSWKKLPPRPTVGDTFCDSLKLACDKTSGTYKVICVVGETMTEKFSIQVYDSKTETWRRKEIAWTYLPFPWSHRLEYLNGVVYMLACHRLPASLELGLLAFNLEEWEIDRLPLQHTDDIIRDQIADELSMVVCNGRLLFILTDVILVDGGGYFPETLTVLEIDLVSLRVTRLCTGSVSSLIGMEGSTNSLRGVERSTSSLIRGMDPIMEVHVPARGDQIFFGSPNRPMLAYNVVTDEWSPASYAGERPLSGERCFSGEILFCDGCFEPGLNPFMAV